MGIGLRHHIMYIYIYILKVADVTHALDVLEAMARGDVVMIADVGEVVNVINVIDVLEGLNVETAVEVIKAVAA